MTTATPATSEGLLLGTAAESCERFRPGYPDEVVDRTLAYGRHPAPTAVEVGAGTGKATRAFASRGVRVTALEPDPAMHAVLRRETLGMPVEPVQASLEQYDGPPADLVYSAASSSDARTPARCRLMATLLRDDGVLAVFGSPLRIADPVLRDAVEAPPGLGQRTASDPCIGDELSASGMFTDVEHHRVPRVMVLPRKEYVGYLSTLEEYLRLELHRRQDVLRRIAAILPEQVRLDSGVDLHLARRV